MMACSSQEGRGQAVKQQQQGPSALQETQAWRWQQCGELQKTHKAVAAHECLGLRAEFRIVTAQRLQRQAVRWPRGQELPKLVQFCLRRLPFLGSSVAVLVRGDDVFLREVVQRAGWWARRRHPGELLGPMCQYQAAAGWHL